MTRAAEVIEPFSTACNIVANAVVLRTLCADAEAPMPRLALGCQVSANVGWLSFGLLQRDYFLGTTALLSLGIQLASLALRARRRAPTRRVRLDTSADELPSFPLAT